MAALGASQFTELLASTRDKITTQGAVDNVTKPHPALDVLRPLFSNGTGESLRANLQLAEEDGGALTDASGTFDTSVSSDIIGSAVFAWSNPRVSRVRLPYKTLQQNAGPEALVKLATTHMTAATRAHTAKIAKALHALDAAVTAGSPISLDQLVSDKKAVGGIDPATQANWKASRLYIPTEDKNIVQALRTVKYAISDNGGDTTGQILLAGGDVFEEYLEFMDDKVRYPSLAKGDTEFDQVLFDGTILRRDPDCPRDRVYFLQPKSLEAEYLNGNFMKVQPAQQVPGTLDYVTPMASIYALGTNKRNDHGLLVRGAEPTGRTA